MFGDPQPLAEVHALVAEHDRTVEAVDAGEQLLQPEEGGPGQFFGMGRFVCYNEVFTTGLSNYAGIRSISFYVVTDLFPKRLENTCTACKMKTGKVGMAEDHQRPLKGRGQLVSFQVFGHPQILRVDGRDRRSHTAP